MSSNGSIAAVLLLVLVAAQGSKYDRKAICIKQQVTQKKKIERLEDFTIHIEDAKIEALKERLRNTAAFPDQLADIKPGDNSYGLEASSVFPTCRLSFVEY